MVRLHGSDDSPGPETFDEGGTEMLCMFNPKSPASKIRLALEDRQSLVVGPVPDGVNGHLQLMEIRIRGLNPQRAIDHP